MHNSVQSASLHAASTKTASEIEQELAYAVHASTQLLAALGGMFSRIEPVTRNASSPQSAGDCADKEGSAKCDLSYRIESITSRIRNATEMIEQRIPLIAC